MGVSSKLEALGLLKSEKLRSIQANEGNQGRVRRYDIVVWAARSEGRACRAFVGPDASGARVDARGVGGGVPVVRGMVEPSVPAGCGARPPVGAWCRARSEVEWRARRPERRSHERAHAGDVAAHDHGVDATV